MPIKGDSFSTLERKIFIGFYSKKTLPYFAFAYSYGKRGHQQLRDRIMSHFDKSILFSTDKPKKISVDPFYNEDGSIKKFNNI